MFDFQKFIEELRSNPEKKEVVQKYEELFGPIEGDVKDQLRYKEYVSKFEPYPYKVPESVKDEFDWDLLLQLVMASFSCDWMLEFNEWEELPELVITVETWDNTIIKKVSELWGFQIKRLYEIYIEEQMNLHVLTKDENEAPIVESQRQARLQRWQNILAKIKAEKEKQAYEQQKKAKLDELMSKL